MQENQWAEISCIVPSDMAEALADFMLDLTGNGVSVENRRVDTFDVSDIAEEPLKTVKGYHPADGSLAEIVKKLDSFLSAVGPDYQGFVHTEPLVSLLTEEDWANSWKVNFKPTRIGKHLVMKPSWEEYTPQTGDVVLELDPGMAFGTGTHGTTRLCLEALEQLVYEGKGLKPGNSKVLDVGCGSGVLAIAAALFGATQVTAIDIDPVAVEVTVENAAVNGVTDRVLASTTPLEKVQGEFAVVLANILAEALVKMGDDLVGRVAAGGCLILSGILTEREEFVIEGFARFGLEPPLVTRQDEWSCLVYRRKGE